MNRLTYLLASVYILLLCDKVLADSLSDLQVQCADLGFKVHTPANGKCVLKLLKSNPTGEGLSSRIMASGNSGARVGLSATPKTETPLPMTSDLRRESVPAKSRKRGVTSQDSDSFEAANARAVQRQKEYELQAELERRDRELFALRQQQEEQLALQRRMVAAQEEAARAQSRASSTQAWSNAFQMLNGTGNYYKPPPRAPITCTTFGMSTTCQ